MHGFGINANINSYEQKYTFCYAFDDDAPSEKVMWHEPHAQFYDATTRTKTMMFERIGVEPFEVKAFQKLHLILNALMEDSWYNREHSYAQNG